MFFLAGNIVVGRDQGRPTSLHLPGHLAWVIFLLNRKERKIYPKCITNITADKIRVGMLVPTVPRYRRYLGNCFYRYGTVHTTSPQLNQVCSSTTKKQKGTYRYRMHFTERLGIGTLPCRDYPNLLPPNNLHTQVQYRYIKRYHRQVDRWQVDPTFHLEPTGYLPTRRIASPLGYQYITRTGEVPVPTIPSGVPYK